MQDILIILGCIVLGMALGWRCRSAAAFLRVADKCALVAVYCLLFILGAGIGGDPALMGALPKLGARALCISVCCTLGSALCLVPLRRHLSPADERTASNARQGGTSPLWGCVKILAVFVLGAALSRMELTPAWLSGGRLALYALYFLVFAVGIGLGANMNAFRIPRALHLKILSVPLLIIAGSAVGSVVAACLLPGVSLRDSLSVGMGLGYYSLASILIENSGGSAALASVALLSNILREVMSILAAPLLVRYLGGISCVGAAGATAMDTTLPIIARFAGERVAVVAVFSGMTLTVLVPFLVTATLRF